MAQTQYKNIDLRGYLDINKNELRNARIQNLGSDPGSPVEGQALWRTDTHRLRTHNGTAFTDQIAGDFYTAKGDIITATANNTPVRKAVGANRAFLIADSAQADGLVWRAIQTADIPSDTVTYATMQNVSATDRLLGRDTAGSGDIEELTVGGGIEFTGSGGIQTSALTGDVTKTAGGTSTTISSGAVTLGKMANLAANSFIGNNTGSSATPIALTVAQAKTLLDISYTDISDFNTGVRLNRLDQMAAPTASVAMNGQLITGLANGVSAQDAATVSQLNALTTGQAWKQPVVAVSTTNITLSGTQTIDGQAVAVGDRVLVAGQTTTANNGIYIVASGAWTRATDMDIAAEATKGSTTLVLNGTVNRGDVFTQTLVVTTLGTDAQTWVKTGDTNTLYSADESSLTLSGGTTFSIKAGGIDLSGAQIGAAALPAAKGGTGQTSYAVGDILYASASTTLSKLADVATGNVLLSGGVTTAPAWGKVGLTTHVSGILPEANGGTGASTFLAALATASGVRKYATAITGGATTEVVTHNLNTRDIVSVSLINPSTPWDSVEVEWAATSVNTITLTSPINLPATYRCIVAG